MRDVRKALPSAVAFLIGCLGSLTVPVANASLTAYGDHISWTAAVGGSYQLENFEDTVLNPGLTITGPGVLIGVPGTYSFGTLVPPTNVLHDVVNDTDTLTISFSAPMIAMGAVWDLFGPGGPGSNITLNLVTGGTETYLDFFPNTLAGGFFGFKGFVSTNAFSSIVLAAGTGCCQETFEMDNMKYVQAVPEPETYAMLLAGLGLMGFVARRRQKALAG